eukprot:2278093-Prymnesium_polylepis.1
MDLRPQQALCPDCRGPATSASLEHDRPSKEPTKHQSPGPLHAPRGRSTPPHPPYAIPRTAAPKGLEKKARE